MCTNIFLNNKLDRTSSQNVFESLLKTEQWETLLKLFSLNIISSNIKDCRGRNALYFAILNKKYEYFKPLLDLKVDSQVSCHLNAINFAVCLDDTRAIEILLRCGLDINTLDEIGCSALLYSILYNKKRSMDFLIKNHADMEIEDFMGNCAKELLKNRI